MTNLIGKAVLRKVVSMIMLAVTPIAALSAVPTATNGNQYRADTDTAIKFRTGAITSGTGVYFESKVVDSDGDKVRMEVELRKLPGNFTGTATHKSELTQSGARARTSTAVLTSGDYGWRYRVVDSTGAASNWVTEGNPDFIVQPGQESMAAPRPVTPVSGLAINQSTPLLEWTGGKGFKSLEVNVSKAPYGAANIVYTSQSLSANESSLRLPADLLKSSTHFRWDITACSSLNGRGTCTTSAKAYFVSAPTSSQLPQTPTSNDIKSTGFNWTNGDNACHGSGAFPIKVPARQLPTPGQTLNFYLDLGEIPAGKKGVHISVTSPEAPAIDWQLGSIELSDKVSKTKWDAGDAFHGAKDDGRSVKISGVLRRPLTVKIFSLRGSYELAVEYSWEDTEGCNAASAAPSMGSGTFSQSIRRNEITEVAVLEPGFKDVYIAMDAESDIDIQLYDTATGEKIINRDSGILNGPASQIASYRGISVEWSGYEGDGINGDREFVRLRGTLTRPLTLKVFGKESGEARVNYFWGLVPPIDDAMQVNNDGTFFDPLYNRNVDPAKYRHAQHLGTDYYAHGGTEVRAILPGVVVECVDSDDPWDTRVIIDHGANNHIVYGHVVGDIVDPKTGSCVGAKVEQNQRIGYVEFGIKDVFGSHLHLGYNFLGLTAYFQPSGKDSAWGWGRAPLSTSRSKAEERGWVDVNAFFRAPVMP